MWYKRYHNCPCRMITYVLTMVNRRFYGGVVMNNKQIIETIAKDLFKNYFDGNVAEAIDFIKEHMACEACTAEQTAQLHNVAESTRFSKQEIDKYKWYEDYSFDTGMHGKLNTRGKYAVIDDRLEDVFSALVHEEDRRQFKLNPPAGIFTEKDVIKNGWELNWEHRVLVLNPLSLKPSARKSENQLWLATGGFGCDPHSMGNAVFTICLGDGESARWNRGDFLGVFNNTLTSTEYAIIEKQLRPQIEKLETKLTELQGEQLEERRRAIAKEIDVMKTTLRK